MVKLLGYIAIIILGALLLAVLTIPLILLNGWVLSWLWLWFMVPLGLPVISLAHSIGIAGIVGFMTKQYTSDKNEEEKYERMAYGLLAPFIALGGGYIIHSFM